MNKGLTALATGSFALGCTESVMMGMLALVATDLGISVADAGAFVSMYAIGACAGVSALVFGRHTPPRTLLVGLILICALGNGLSAIAPNAGMLMAARFIAGLAHGSFFGTAALAAKMLANPGEAGKAIAGMVLGQTLATTVGVPLGTLLASSLSWRVTFVLIAAWAVSSSALMLHFVPKLKPIRDAGLAGQFTFLAKPSTWLVLCGVMLGNTGIFCWWSFVSPWLTQVARLPEALVPACMVLSGVGMVVGSQLGGRTSDRMSPGVAAAVGQLIAGCTLLSIGMYGAGAPAVALALVFACAFGMFFVSGPQQALMVEAGEGGGELVAGACVQIAFNGGNALGATIGGAILGSGGTYGLAALAGMPCSLLAACALGLFILRSRTGGRHRRH